MPTWRLGDLRLVDPMRRRPLLMGILNVTPDSFSDGGRFADASAATDRALQLVADGADVLDLGGESSRPGAEPVSLAEEMRRVLPVLERLAGSCPVPISIDTAKPEVARAALAAGATIVNDIGGLREPAMRALLAEHPQTGCVLMHMLGTPPTMQTDPHYDDATAEIAAYLGEQVGRAEAEGIARDRIAIDPGIGFGKRSSHNLALLHRLDALHPIGCAVLIGTSRKGFLGQITGRPVTERLVGSVVSSLAAAVRGADVLRVHDVAETRDALIVWEAIVGWTERS